MFKKKHILVIDDDERLRNLLMSFLFEKGYLVDISNDTKSAKTKMSNILYDLIILDVMLPDESGIVFAKKNINNINIPILMLSAMSDVEDRIKGLKTGVDEYLCKPFEPEELLLRIENIIKRTSISSKTANAIMLGDCHFNSKEHTLEFNNKAINLTINESKVLFHLYKNSNNAVKREELASLLNVSDRTIDVIIKRLRSKISIIPYHQNLLLTSRGIGYKMEIDLL
ncbi:MAG: TorCAD operon transcriptional regulatory protein TorR [Alphaproteobacteria bacterium MarineAlpha9_Bin4]|nr:DNA-binding response regulator [Pelagibacterales bacterium]PPR26300.1 MAG: TorCAD operon transcriptional regulatory protein TorR [Alphaproteobacteria bacterium MarineAlpha9_Bin4]